ncbi:MAG: ATP-binding protein [Myxococcales bacterium]|nr:ATP-binding protein [Myxococcales bacterium]
MTSACGCELQHVPRVVVLTGGPGAGKTAVLEVLQQQVCRHVAILPEVASILWKGGFPRRSTTSGRRAAQRAITRVQIELQRIAIEEPTTGLVVCDRGTIDGLAYWPGEPAEYYEELDTTEAKELGRYATVIHMESATRDDGYFATSTRVESVDQAQEIDRRILAAWSNHPHRVIVPSSRNFLLKLDQALALVRAEIPVCCR